MQKKRDRTSTAGRGALTAIFVIAFLDTLGMTIVMPVLPFLIRRYANGADSVAVWVGVLMAVFALCTFLSAPALGALSDRVGRKPVLVLSVLGSAVGLVIFGIGGAMWVLLAARVIDGLTAGNMSTVMAYLADITPEQDRSRRFGTAGAVSGFGFLAGPAAGGFLAHFGLAVPVFVAAGASVAAALLALLALPESLAAEHRTTRVALAELHPFRAIGQAFERPGLRALILVALAIGIPIAGLQSNISVLAVDALRWGPSQIGLLMVGVGVADIVVQGAVVGRLSDRLGESRTIAIGLLVQMAAYLALAVVAMFTSPWLFVFGGLMIAAGEGVADPALSALASRTVSHREQGRLMGAMSSMGAAARVVGPLLAGALYAVVGRAAPYWFGVIAVAAVLVGAPRFLRPQLPRTPKARPRDNGGMKNRALLKYVAAVVLFGSNGIVASHIAMTSSDIVLTRTGIGALFLAVAFVVTRTRARAWENRRHFALLLASGAAMGASWLFLFEAYRQVGVSVATLAYYTGPVIVMVLAPIVFKERLAVSSVAGFIAVAAGMLLVNGQELAHGHASIGLAFGLLSAVAYAAMVVLNKKAGRIKGLENPMWQLIAAFSTVAVFVGLRQGFAVHVPAASWPAVLLLGLVNTGLGCYLYFSSIGQMRAQSVAVLGYLEPLSALLLAAAFLGEALSPLQLAGAALILGGAVFGETLRLRTAKDAGAKMPARSAEEGE